MEIQNNRRTRSASVRLAARVLILAVGLALCFTTPAVGQVTFTTSATVSHNLQGRLIQHGLPEALHSDVDSLSTNNPLANPIALTGSIAGSLGNAGGNASLSADVTTVATAGLMRASVNGATNASWTSNQSIAAISPSTVTVGWSDAYILLGNPANPQPGRTLHVQSFLRITGSMQHSLTDPALEFGIFPGASTVRVTLRVTGNDHLGRGFFPGSELAVSQGATRTDIRETLEIPAPGILPIQLIATEGAIGSMTFQMRLDVSGSSGTGSQYFGPDSTAMTFSADYGNTIAWGGITSVTDATTGDPVPGWSISSASGVDYANAVPEPGSAFAVLMLLLPLTARRRSGR